MTETGLNGLTGPLLRAGRRGDYTSLGEVGQPVFRVADQLREALKRKLGAVDGDSGLLYADHFAIPKTDQLGDTIDWYASFSGDVIPWESATEEERDVARGYLRNLEHRLTAYRESFALRQKGSGQQRSQDAQVFAKLLSKILYTPDANHVYLVNGFPVLAFWGFTYPKAKLPLDPFLPLFPKAAPVVAPVINSGSKPMASSALPPAAVSEKVAGRPWWRYLLWLLLLLLLLWLLLFGLRACSPAVADKFGMPAFSFNQNNPPANKPQVPALHETKDARLVSVNPDFVGGNKRMSGVEGTTGPGLAPAAILGPEPGKPDNSMEAGGRDTGKPAPRVQPENNLLLPDDTSGSQTGMTDPPVLTNPSLLPEEAGLPNDPALAGVPAPSVTAQNLELPALAPDGPARFLNGTWKAGSGIQDKRTGKPLSLEYEFNQGSGKVTLQNVNGAQCSGDASAKMVNGHLHIDSLGRSVCADGSSFEMPEVVCAPGATSAADCIGKYDDTSFPINMRNENK